MNSQNDTTNLNQLPNISNLNNDSAPQISNQNNITMTRSEINNTEQNIVQQSNNQNNYNELINQLQNASAKGATNLPSRDIPLNKEIITQDQEVKPNYIPNTDPNDYISNYLSKNDLINKDNQNTNVVNNVEYLYKEFQTSIIICILYFIFQSPYFKKSLFNILPVLFNKENNFTIRGMIFISIFFASLYYVINKSIIILSS